MSATFASTATTPTAAIREGQHGQGSEALEQGSPQAEEGCRQEEGRRGARPEELAAAAPGYQAQPSGLGSALQSRIRASLTIAVLMSSPTATTSRIAPVG